jgi:hypothetical protein
MYDSAACYILQCVGSVAEIYGPRNGMDSDVSEQKKTSERVNDVCNITRAV